MIDVEQTDHGGGVVSLDVEWNPNNAGMDIGSTPGPGHFRIFIDAAEVTVDNVNWLDAFTLELQAFTAPGSAFEVHLLTESSDLKNTDGITAKAPQVITAP